jgi:trimeric autotransporter adhesin
MVGTRRVSIVVAVAMFGGMLGAAVPALPAAAIVADPSSINQHFITGASSPFGVAVVSVDSDHVYWGNAGTDTIGRANLDGSAPDENFINARVNTSGNQEATNGVAVFGNHIYWSNQFTGTIGMATLNGDGPASALNKQFITGGNQTTRVVVTGPHIYWANNGNNTIGRADLDSNGNLISNSVNQDYIDTGAGPVGLAVDSNHVYWANQLANSIGRADLDGNGNLVPLSTNNSFITAGVTTPAGVAVDSAHIYWANYSVNTVSVANLGDGSNVQVLITGANSPRGVAVDSNFIYWANNGDGSIGRAALVDVPGAPTIGTATGGIGTGSVTFTPPADDGGKPILHFDALCTSSNLGVSGSASGSSSPIMVTGLTPGATYTCTVTATNAIGTGLPSAASNPFIAATTPAPPVIGAAAASGFGGVSVTFTPGPNGGSAITSFTVTCTSATGQVSGSASGTGSPTVVTGLQGGTPYTCFATETNAVGASGPSGSTEVIFPQSGNGDGGVATGAAGGCTLTPTAPSSPSASPQAFPGATVSWTAPISGCVAGYIVTPYLNGVAQAPTLIPGLGTTTVIKGLISGDTYTFTVAAENGLSAGPMSVMTTPVTIGAPGPASAVKVAATARGSVKVSFGPARGNGAPIKSYAATCVSSNGGKTRTRAGKTSPLTVTGLTAGKSYRCTVAATNSRGTGTSSTRSAAVKA